MTVSSQTNSALYVGNGVTTLFPIPFRYFENGDIHVYLINPVSGAATSLTLGVDYSLTGAGDPEMNGAATGTLTTTVAVPNLTGLYFERVLDLEQNTDIINQGQFFAETHEDVFDRLTMLLQQINANSQGAIRVAIGDPEPARLPPALSRANQLMGFNSLGDPTPIAPIDGGLNGFALDLANSSDPAKGAAKVGYRGRTVYDRLNEVIYEKDRGVKRDGVTDDTAALQAAINEAAAANKILISGPGVAMQNGLTAPDNLRWYGVGTVNRLRPNTNASLLVNANTAAGNSNIEIQGIEFDGNRANQGATSNPCVLLKKVAGVILRRVKAYNARIAVYTTDTYDQILMVDCTNTLTEFCESYNSDQGALGYYGTGGEHIIRHNYIHDSPAGIEGAYQTDSRIYDNKVRNTQLALISFSGLRNRIYDNDVRGASAGAGIVCGHSGSPTQAADFSYVENNYIENVFSYGVTTFEADHVKVRGNTIVRTSGNSTHSIFINTGCADVDVSDNTIIDYFTAAAGACGIFVDGCADFTGNNNKIYGAKGNTTGHAIRLFNNCPDFNLNDNTCVDSSTSGIITSAGSTGGKANNNTIRTSGGAAMNIGGAGTTANDNNLRANTGAQCILINAELCTVNANRLVGTGTGILINAQDFNTVVANVCEGFTLGISFPTGTDSSSGAANTFKNCTTSFSNGGANNKLAHNIGVATHDI